MRARDRSTLRLFRSPCMPSPASYSCHRHVKQTIFAWHPDFGSYGMRLAAPYASARLQIDRDLLPAALCVSILARKQRYLSRSFNLGRLTQAKHKVLLATPFRQSRDALRVGPQGTPRPSLFCAW